MSSMFDDILNRAERLTSANVHSNFVPSEPSTNKSQYVGEHYSSDLTDIFRASENLWKRKAPSADSQKAFLFGEKGVVLGGAPKIQEKIQDKVSSVIEDEDLEENINRVRMEAERTFFNQVLLHRPHHAMHVSRPNTSAAFGASVAPAARFHGVSGPSVGDRRQAVFGDKLRKYLRSGKKKDLSTLFTEAVRETTTDDVMAELWSQVIAMVGKRAPAGRDELDTTVTLVEKACNFLHKSFVEHMQRCVERNLERAERGGIPGTRGLVGAYIKACCDIEANAEDGNIDGCPVWQVVYLCFRAGDITAAKDALNVLANFPRSAVLVSALNHLAKEPRLDAEIKKKLKVEWRHEQNGTRDSYRRALYCSLLACDSPLADTMENWLWCKLIALRIDPTVTDTLYREVQKNISIDYGESYFMAGGPSDFHFYFTSLWLSGQFEKSINLLVEVGQLVDAVHMCILAKENGYLRVTDPQKDARHSDLVVTPDQTFPTRVSISVARLMVGYTKSFEMVDIESTLDYFYLLKGEQTAQGSDIFEAAVSRSVYLTGDVTNILGALKNGKRQEALIDCYDVDVQTVIARVANDTELEGDTLQAINLFHLCGDDDRAVSIMCTDLSDSLRGDRRNIEKVYSRAEQLAREASNASMEKITTLSYLLDIAGLLSVCDQGNVSQTLEILRKIRLIPCDTDQVHTYTANGHMVSQEVQSVLPDVCLHVMQCMVEGVKNARAHEKQIMYKQAQAIVMYAASSQYKFPQNIVSKILTLQVHIQ